MVDRRTRRHTERAVPDRGRRLMTASVIGAIGWLLPVRIRAASVRSGIAQPSRPVAAEFMARASEMRAHALRSGDQAYGAVIVRQGIIVGQAPSRVVVNRDPTAHAELEAIRDAARNLGTRNLSGCVLYSTSRACPMCEAAAYWAGIDAMRHGESIADAGAPQLLRC